MKRTMLCVGLMILLALGLSVLGSKAQAQTRVVLAANVPFDFTIGGIQFNSGRVEIKRIAYSEVFSGGNGKGVAFFHAIHNIDLKRDPVGYTLCFRVYGGHAFLSEVWEGTEGHRLTMSPTEIKLAKSMEAQVSEVTAVGK